MEASEFVATVETLHADARARGLFFQTCTDDELVGRSITVDGRSLLSFGSCSYLGLEYHPALRQGAIDFVQRYGTQFASSRGYLSAPHYDEFEDTLCKVFGAHVVTAQTTTLAHQAMFDTVLTEKDAVVLDHQVHYSVQRAATLARAAGARVELVRHERLHEALDLCALLAKKYRTVWFATDGITSMYGDYAPVGLLQDLLDVAPNVRLYVDDAHGMTWKGEHGRGSILTRMPRHTHERMVVAVSLAKAFAAGGAALIFQTHEEKERVRLCGGPMVFSGPLQPPLLGAALASAKLHLEPELDQLQQALAERVAYANRRTLEAGLPLLVENDVPILFLRCGLPKVAADVAGRVADDGLYVNVSMYPAVPMRRGGIRVGITATHSEAEIDRLVESLARHVPAALADHGVTRAELDDLFAGAAVADRYAAPAAERLVQRVMERAGKARESGPVAIQRDEADGAVLEVERRATIHEVDRAEWDSLFGARGCCSWEAMAAAEGTFRGQPRKEHNWEFHYVIVRDQDRRVRAATFFTVSIQKDDMLMREAVSRAVEERRRVDPYYLSSRVTMAGSGLSEGDHLYVDRSRPWRAALERLVQAGAEIYEASGSDLLVVRDLAGDDGEMDQALLQLGLLKIPNLDSHRLAVPAGGDEGLLATLSRKSRRFARRIFAESERYAVEVVGHGSRTPAPAELATLHGLYLNVARRKLRYNAFELPEDLLSHLATSPAWELVILRLAPEAGGPADGTPVAFWAAHRHEKDYAPLFCGLDYRYVETHGVYRQMLRQMVRRAQDLGAGDLHLGMDAEVEKQRWGAVGHPTCLYVMARGDWHGALLRDVVEALGVERRSA